MSAPESFRVLFPGVLAAAAVSLLGTACAAARATVMSALDQLGRRR